MLRTVRAWLFGNADRSAPVAAAPAPAAPHDESASSVAPAEPDASPQSEPPAPVEPRHDSGMARPDGDSSSPEAGGAPPDPTTAGPTAAIDPGAPGQGGAGPATAPDSKGDGGVPSAAGADSAAVASRQERAAERLLEDERLRGDLTDDEYQPLLDWALVATDALAASTAGLSDAEAERRIDAGLGQLKDLVQAAGAVVSAMLDRGAISRNAELGRLPDLVRAPLVPDERVADARARLSTALERITRDPDLAGTELATALAEALRGVTQDATEMDGPGA